MFEIVLMNNKGEKFTKKYESYYLWQKDLQKYKYSKKLKIISYGRRG